MNRKSQSGTGSAGPSMTRRTFAAGAGALGLVAGTAPFSIVRAAGGPLKVGVILPRSGYMAGIGQDCQRGVDIAGPILKGLGYPDLEIMSGDTELSVDTARSRAEKLIADGAQLLVGAFDSGRELGHRPGRRAEGHSLRHQYRRGAGHHRAGLQVRLPQLPDRADHPWRCLRQPDGNLRHDRCGAEDGGVPARQRHLRHRHGQGRSAPCRPSSRCPTRSSTRSPTTRRPRTCRSR